METRPAFKSWPQSLHLSNEGNENLSSPRCQVNSGLADRLSLSGTRKIIRSNSVVRMVMFPKDVEMNRASHLCVPGASPATLRSGQRGCLIVSIRRFTFQG